VSVLQDRAAQQPDNLGVAQGSRLAQGAGLAGAYRTAEPAQRRPRTLSPRPAKRQCAAASGVGKAAAAAAAAAAKQSPRRSWVQLAPAAAASPPRLPHSGAVSAVALHSTHGACHSPCIQKLNMQTPNYCMPTIVLELIASLAHACRNCTHTVGTYIHQMHVHPAVTRHAHLVHCACR
jgi:hypothetical protein